VNQAFPLELKVPNAETQAAIEVSRMMLSMRKAGFVNAGALLAHLEERSRQ
jgi:DNA-damage-inducible protein J